MSDAKTKIYQAIYNNNGLYEVIFENRQIEFERTEFVRYCLQKTPPLYSNLVTLSPSWQPDDIFQSIDFNYEKEKWSEWSIKDSFNVLDLSDYGFFRFFEAQLMHLESAKFKPIEEGKNFRYKIVKDAEVLASWRIVWNSDEQLGKEIFNPKLLENPKVYFIAGYNGEELQSGCLINETDDVLGISNFFAPDKNIKYWSGIIEFVFSSIKPANIFGYERTHLVNQLESLGFESLGNLSVWLKKRI